MGQTQNEKSHVGEERLLQAILALTEELQEVKDAFEDLKKEIKESEKVKEVKKRESDLKVMSWRDTQKFFGDFENEKGAGKRRK